MTDTSQQTDPTQGAAQGGQGSQGTSDNSRVPAGLVLDKNKTSEQYIREAEITYIVPVLIREKYQDLIKLIVETESMDKEEREYWLSIMPVMTEDQIIKLRNILINEKEQLSKIDQDYQKNAKKPVVAIDENKLKAQFEKIKVAEQNVEAEEQAQEAEILKALESL